VLIVWRKIQTTYQLKKAVFRCSEAGEYSQTSKTNLQSMGFDQSSTLAFIYSLALTTKVMTLAHTFAVQGVFKI
jgi:hypothetical protein